jgi:microcystin-dependent protein
MSVTSFAAPNPATTNWVPIGPAASTYDSVPIGATISFSGKTIPGGYVLADGTRYTQVQYPQAYAFAGQEVAAGNALWTQRTSDTTFTVPDLRDKFLFNASTAIPFGQAGGEKTHTLSVAEMPAHGHIVSGPVNHSWGANFGTTGPSVFGFSPDVVNGNGAYNSDPLAARNTGGDGSHNTMPPYVAIAQLVKIQPVASSYSSPVVNGQFVKGVGGTAVWSSIIETDVRGLTVADTAWHVVGTAGEPAFQNGYSSWDGLGATARAPRFRKLASGLVLVDGIFYVPNPLPSPNVGFTLPPGYRIGPRGDLTFIVNAATGPCIANVQPSGDIAITPVGGGVSPLNTWVYIDGIRFYAEA